MQIVVLNHSIIRGHIASLHREGCRDIQRDRDQHGSYIHGPYDGVEAALTDYLDAEMVEMGYDRRDVKIHNCCKGA